MTKECPNCGYTNLDDATVCRVCGNNFNEKQDQRKNHIQNPNFDIGEPGIVVAVIFILCIGFFGFTLFFQSQSESKICLSGQKLCGYSSENDPGICYNPESQSCCGVRVFPGGTDHVCCGDKTCNMNEECCNVRNVDVIPTCYDTEKYECEYHFSANSMGFYTLRLL